MTQTYGYNEVGDGLKNIKHFENDYTLIGSGLLSFPVPAVRCRFRLRLKIS
jgi:hypothetical protein